MKKSIPLSLLKAIQPHIDSNRHLIIPVLKTDSLYHFLDKDPQSDFYFKISPPKKPSKYVIEFKPRNMNSVGFYSAEHTIEEVTNLFDKWTTIIKSYNEIISIYDDPILEAYQKEFETEFEIVDEDADRTPFSLEQQLFIDEHLTNAIKRLSAASAEENKSAITELIQDAENIKKEQTHLTKKEVIRRLSKFWAKTRKISISLLKEIFIETRKEIIRHLLKAGFEIIK